MYTSTRYGECLLAYCQNEGGVLRCMNLVLSKDGRAKMDKDSANSAGCEDAACIYEQSLPHGPHEKKKQQKQKKQKTTQRSAQILLGAIFSFDENQCLEEKNSKQGLFVQHLPSFIDLHSLGSYSQP